MTDSQESAAPVRGWFWVIALSSALVLAGLSAWLQAWFDLKFIGGVYLPAVPVGLFALFALVINPLLRRIGIGYRRKELLILAACWVMIGGTVDLGLVSHWKKNLLAEDALSTNSRATKPPPANVFGKPNTISFKEAAPNALSLSARADIDAARGYIAAYEAAGDAAARQAAIDAYQALDLKARYAWPVTVTAADPANSAETLAALRSSMRVEERLLQALVTEQVAVSSMFLGNDDADRLAELRLEDPEATLDQVSSVAWDEKPMSRLLAPIIQSGWFILFGIIAVFSLLAATSRQWTHNERLTHPLALVPQQLVSGAWLSRAFRVGFILMLVVWIWQIMTSNGLSLPAMPLNDSAFLKVTDAHEAPFLGIETPSSAKWVYSSFWNTIRILPFVIAIAFLVATDVGFSVWSGFFFGALVCGWLYKAGIEVDFARHGRLASGGALFAFAAVVLYLGRVHYWGLLRAAVGVRVSSVADDRLGVWGVRGIIAATLALTVLIYSYSGSIAGAVLALLMTWAIVIVVARIVAESGLVGIQMQPELNAMFASLGFAGWFPLQALIVMGYLGTSLVYDTRENAAGYAVQAQRLGEEAGHGTPRFFVVLAMLSMTAAIVALVVGLLSHIAGPTAVAVGSDALNMGKLLPAAFNPNTDAVFTNQMALLTGIVLVFAVVACRRIWSGFLFHPIGLVVAATWPIYNLWGSLMIGWLVKVLVLRYGGAKVYSDLKPFAIGIIAAEAVGFSLDVFLQFLAKVSGFTYQSASHWPT